VEVHRANRFCEVQKLKSQTGVATGLLVINVQGGYSSPIATHHQRDCNAPC